MEVTPADSVIQTVVYRRYTANWRKPLPNAPRESADGVIPGPLIKARVGDHLRIHFKNMDTLRKQPHSMHFHGVHYAPSSDGAYVPGLLGQGRQREAGPVVHVQAHRGRGLGRRLALPRPLAVDDGLDRRRHVRDALDPRAQREGAGPRVRGRPRADGQVHDDRRQGLRRQHAGLPREGRRARAVGRDGDGIRLPHLPRPRAPLGLARAQAPSRATPRPSARPSRSGSAGARTRRARGSTIATSRIT